ncbi:MAG: DUF2752 domain-containing protein [Holophagaceae bacterium]|nr:DUF2752 domain-containing protein [Holophagaceae bacterium]
MLPGCAFKRLTGFACATCGLTRCVLALGRWDWAGAFHWHPVAAGAAMLLPLLVAWDFVGPGGASPIPGFRIRGSCACRSGRCCWAPGRSRRCAECRGRFASGRTPVMLWARITGVPPCSSKSWISSSNACPRPWPRPSMTGTGIPSARARSRCPTRDSSSWAPISTW